MRDFPDPTQRIDLQWPTERCSQNPNARCLRIITFAAFGGAKWLYPAPGDPGFPPNKNTPGVTSRGHSQIMERETGIEPATLSLGRRSRRKQ